MDADRFDTLTRAFLMGSSRRTVLGLSLGGVLSPLALDVSEAKKKKKKCPPCKKRKKGKCKGRLPDGTACASGTCQSGVCTPPPPGPFCAGKNECALGPSVSCEANGGATCFCWVRQDTVMSFCGSQVRALGFDCAICTGSEVCVLLGGECGNGIACVIPCPNPR